MKLLYTLIFAFFMGCDYAPTEHTHNGYSTNICVQNYQSIYYCYSNQTPAGCLENTSLNYWFENTNCEEFCSGTEIFCISTLSECEETPNTSTYQCDKY